MVRYRAWNGVVAKAGEKALLSLENMLGTGETFRRQLRGEDAGLRRTGRVEMLAHRAGCQEFPKAGGLRARIAERPNGLFLAEAKQVGRCHGRPEGSACGGVVPDPVVSLADGHADAAAGFVSGQNSLEKGVAAEIMGITAPRLQDLGLIDIIVDEPTGGAHRAHQAMARNLKQALQEALQKLAPIPTRDLLKARLARVMAYGRVKEQARR